ncbi:unnamed protein product [Haemonchus placei]|uniref:CCHC-type domain-containing protein n=1 Tax=Haemonchus placei TaxID=6290 RepID=A0A0N4X8K8_HAEPC|nr:unnamed protein product [Haemonchus placei]
MSSRSDERGTKPGTLPVPSAQADEEGSVPQHGGQADPPSHVDIFRKALMASEQLSRSPSVDTVNAQLDQVTVEDEQQMDIDQVGDTEEWRGLLGRIAPTCEAAIKAKIRNISAAKLTYIIDCVREKVDYAIAQIESSLLTTKSEADEFLEKLALPLEELKVITVRESGQAEVLRELTGILQCSEGDLTEVVREQKQSLLRLSKVIQSFQDRGVGPQHASTSHTQAAAGNEMLRVSLRTLRGSEPLQGTPLGSLHGSSKSRDGHPPPPKSISEGQSRRSSTVSSLAHSRGESYDYSDPHKCCSCESGSQGHMMAQTAQMISGLKEVMKAQCLKEVVRYNGKNSLGDFLRTMDFKYPKSAWTDSERRDILVTLLEGQAKMLYRTLPKEVKKGPYEGLVKELKVARSTPGERLKLLKEWDTLQKR